MALGFSSHYKHDNKAGFGSLTKGNFSNESESAGSVAMNNDTINLYGSVLHGLDYDNCEFSTSVVIDYSQYANIAESSGAETAGSIAMGGSFDMGCSGGASFSSGNVSVSSGCSGGCSTSFTC